MSTASPVDAVTVPAEVWSAVALLLRCVVVPSKRTATIPFAVVAARAVYCVDLVASSAGACVQNEVIRAARLVFATTTGIEAALHAAYPVGGGNIVWKRPGKERWTPSSELASCTAGLSLMSAVRALLQRSNRCAVLCFFPRFFLHPICGFCRVMHIQSDAQKRSKWFVDQPDTLDGLKMMFNAQQNMTSQHKFLGASPLRVSITVGPGAVADV